MDESKSVSSNRNHFNQASTTSTSTTGVTDGFQRVASHTLGSSLATIGSSRFQASPQVLKRATDLEELKRRNLLSSSFKAQRAQLVSQQPQSSSPSSLVFSGSSPSGDSNRQKNSSSSLSPSSPGGVNSRRRGTNSSSSGSSSPQKLNPGDESKVIRQKKNDTFRFFFKMPELPQPVVTYLPATGCLSDAKSELLNQARSLVRDLIQSGLLKRDDLKEVFRQPEDYIFKVAGLQEYLTNESLALHRIDFLQVCTKSFVTPQFELCLRENIPIVNEDVRKAIMVEELKLATDIHSLIGSEEVSAFLSYENDEVAEFRRNAIKARLEINEIMKSKALRYKEQILPEYVYGEPIPLVVPERLNAIVYYKKEIKWNMMCSPIDRASTLKDMVVKKLIRARGQEAGKDIKLEDFVLKVTGFQEFFYGETQLIAYDHIRRSLGKNETISLSLVELESLKDILNEASSDHRSVIDDLLLVNQPGSNELLEKNSTNDELLSACNDQFQLTINNIEQAFLVKDVQLTEDLHVYIRAEIFHAGHKLGSCFTLAAPASNTPQWNETLVFDSVALKYISIGCKIVFTAFLRRSNDPTTAWQKGMDKSDEAVSWVACQLIDHTRHLVDGVMALRMWLNSDPNPVGSSYQNLLNPNAPILFVEFHGRTNEKKRLLFPEVEIAENEREKRTVNEETHSKLMKIIQADPLTELSVEDHLNLLANRHYISQFSTALPKFLLSVKWDDCMQVKEAHKMLFLWAQPGPLQAMELLDAKFADPVVRDYGVKCLQYMSDGECNDFMLQLTQVVKHEPYHQSALAMFLLRRAWSNPKIGHSFYWYLKAEMHQEDAAERYTLLLEAYLRGAKGSRKELIKQNLVTEKLVGVAQKIKEISNAEQRKAVLVEALSKLKFPSSFQLPLDPRIQVRGLHAQKCKYMDSKKLPLWLVWENDEEIGPPINVIFKVGDDLRQDVLTLQVIRIMDKMWKNEGLDLLLNPYGCIATGDEIGMIEVVMNADTTANINKAAGGTKAVLKVDTLTKWLKQYNQKEQFRKAQETFAKSSAGYCVATFVLGIGDRHNDNIMLTREGHLFHIDFGHFLGNFKKKYGIKRERAPFIFTPQYAHVLGGKGAELFNCFVDHCCTAFNILRRHSDMFITLFQMMLCTGIPELRSAEDLEYLRGAFAIGMTDEEAAAYFTKLIYSSLHTKTTIINDAIHVFVHR